MSIYKYIAKNGPQDIVKGEIEASSEKEAIEKISDIGYIPVSIEESKAHTKDAQQLPDRHVGRVRPRQVTVLSRQLSGLLRSGVPILPAIDIIRKQSESQSLMSVLYDIYVGVKDGTVFSSMLSKYPKIFPAIYIAMVRTGESSGTLPEALLRISEYRTKQDETVSRFKMAMIYPVIMGLVGLATIIFMLTFVMPRMMNIFINLGQDLPMPTLILIYISEALRKWWFFIVALLILVVSFFRKQLRTESGRLWLSLLQLRVPVFGATILKAELARFSRTLELLIKSGVSILKAIEIGIPVLENEAIKIELRRSRKELEHGGSFGRSLGSSKIFPLFMTNLIMVGEKSGRLDDALAEVANSYERDVDESIKMLAGLMEPLMILVMGLVVGFIVVAMLLPMFEINIMAG
jgi:type II secretory pathway component PulF